MEKELFEEKERARATLASIGDAVIGTDAAGRIEHMNPAAERLTGWSETEARTQPLESVVHLAGEAPHGALIRRDGSEIAVTQSRAPVHDRSGKVAGGVIVFRSGAR